MKLRLLHKIDKHLFGCLYAFPDIPHNQLKEYNC
jgi:hypothetical protein